MSEVQEKLVIPELEPFILLDSDVIPNGRELGRGAYGSVEEVRIPGALCAAKKLHDQLIQLGSKQQVDQWIVSFVNECKLASKLRHPNIVQFLGVSHLPDSPLPVLLMEKLAISLDELLEKEKIIPFDIKLSILIDVSSGLVFLHCRDPPIVHRDLTARNILLDSALTAKIADLGVARMVNIQPSKLAATMTHAPGNIIYMPPETMGSEKSRYNTAIDIFSFGNVSLFTLTQVFQDELFAANYFDSKTRTLIARTEIQRRSQYINILYGNVGEEHPISKLILQCLEYLPEDRPTATQLLGRLKAIQADTPQEWDLTKLELIHRVEEARLQHTPEEYLRQLAEKQAVIDDKQALIDAIIAEKQTTVDEQQRIITDRQATISEQQRLSAVKQTRIINNEKETTIEKQQATISNLSEKLDAVKQSEDPVQSVSGTRKKSIQNAFATASGAPSSIKFKWTFKTSFLKEGSVSGNASVYSTCLSRNVPIYVTKDTKLVVINGSVFGRGIGRTVPWEYSLRKNTVSPLPLPSYNYAESAYYDLVCINGKLTAVTGYRIYDIDGESETESFTLQCFPFRGHEILSKAPSSSLYERCSPTSIVYKNYLILAGGFVSQGDGGQRFLSDVSIFNITTSEWGQLQKLPSLDLYNHKKLMYMTMFEFSAVVLNDTLFLIEGKSGIVVKTTLQQLPDIQWEFAAEAPQNNHSPVTIFSEFILIFTRSPEVEEWNWYNPEVKSSEVPPSTYLYNPAVDQWTRVGEFIEDIVACTMLPSGELFAVGHNCIKTAVLRLWC